MGLLCLGSALFTVVSIYGFGGELPKCVVIWGSNLVHTGSSDGINGGVVATAVQKAEKVIVVDPRHIAPVKHATHWLQLRPGTDGALAMGFLNVILNEDLYDHSFVEEWTNAPHLIRSDTGTLLRAADLVAGGSLGREAPSAYRESDADLSAIWAPLGWAFR
mgnify:CR=1 FL=1